MPKINNLTLQFFQQEILVKFEEKLLIFYVHNQKLKNKIDFHFT
jgi:hypothetical protein